MKTICVALAILALTILISRTSEAMSLPHASAMSIEGKMNCPVVPPNGGREYLQILVHAPEGPQRARTPVNLCVVLDRSGSMGEEGKIQNAKAALDALIDQLRPGDIFSLVIYDDVIDVLQSASHVVNKRSLHDLVEGIQPRGWTNLGGGMMEGFAQVGRFANERFVNRVVLLSDGLANRGITDPRQLGRIAQRHRDCSISLTTMGVGLDYNENLMVGLAEKGGGNYYYIESPRELTSILRKEFDMLSCVVAQNAVIDLVPGPGVCILDVIGAEFSLTDGHARLPLGDLAGGETREVTVEVEIPEGSGELTVARGELRYDSGTKGSSLCAAFATHVSYSTDAAEIDRHRDLETQAKGDIAASTRRVERAMDALDAGKESEAFGELSAARSMLKDSPAASKPVGGAAILAQDSKLQSYQQTLSGARQDVRKAKKAIQFDNYTTQKKR
ncbi:MAG TPA: VWA domain-containing protein [Bacteroidota bacterium]|nr:VWA domain-containing protein [Bacteroidota bacterium]